MKQEIQYRIQHESTIRDSDEKSFYQNAIRVRYSVGHDVKYDEGEDEGEGDGEGALHRFECFSAAVLALCASH